MFAEYNNNKVSLIARRETEVLRKLHSKNVAMLKMCDAINKVCEDIDYQEIHSYIKKLLNGELLSPLTLKEDEFTIKDEKLDCLRNYRYDSIYLTKTNKIINDYPYNMMVRACYQHENKKQVNGDKKKLMYSMPLYISKGGVITGEKITSCVIKQEDVDKHNYTNIYPINIPVSIITYKEESYFVVDHREPALKVLNKMYDVYELVDEKVKGYKFNLRNYKKLNL